MESVLQFVRHWRLHSHFPLVFDNLGLRIRHLRHRNMQHSSKYASIILTGIVEGVGVQLGPLGTAATYRPIVPAPGDYDDGETGGMIGKGNRGTRRKPAPVPLCPP
jgi:hypothetical protein